MAIPSEIILIAFFLISLVSSAVISVRISRRQLVNQINRDLRRGFVRARIQMRDEFNKGMSQAKLAPPEDVGDGRCF